MADIDVSELLSDPDFVDDVVLIRRAYSVNQYGETELAEQTITIRASVQPAIVFYKSNRLLDRVNVLQGARSLSDLGCATAAARNRSLVSIVFVK